MSNLDKALETQLANIEQRTGKKVDALIAELNASGLEKHMQRVAFLKASLGMGHGDANTIAHLAKQADEPAAPENPLDAIYVDKKAHLRPIHDALLNKMQALGECEVVLKKRYISYRRNKQFVMIGPATNSRVDVGVNAKGLQASPRLLEQPAGRMCQYVVRVTAVEEIDDQLIAWMSEAYQQAG
jgi:predicted transport protein